MIADHLITDKIALKIETAPDGTNQMFAQPIMSKHISFIQMEIYNFKKFI